MKGCRFAVEGERLLDFPVATVVTGTNPTFSRCGVSICCELPCKNAVSARLTEKVWSIDSDGVYHALPYPSCTGVGFTIPARTLVWWSCFVFTIDICFLCIGYFPELFTQSRSQHCLRPTATIAPLQTCPVLAPRLGRNFQPLFSLLLET